MEDSPLLGEDQLLHGTATALLTKDGNTLCLARKWSAYDEPNLRQKVTQHLIQTIAKEMQGGAHSDYVGGSITVRDIMIKGKGELLEDSEEVEIQVYDEYEQEESSLVGSVVSYLTSFFY